MSATTTMTMANGASSGSGISKPTASPYRNFLTPCMHRLFTNAALIGLLTCYVASVLMSPLSLFWSWFPLGAAGLRACLLFTSVLCVFILRIANLRVASRKASSVAFDIIGCLLSRGTYKTLAWYMLSAFLFSETYIHSTDESKELGITDSSKPYERTHLNERPIVLRTLFIMLGVWQTGYHVWRDLDQVHTTKPQDSLAAQIKQSQEPIAVIRAEANSILQHAARSMIIVPIPAILTYTLLLRRAIWSWTFYFSKSIFSNLPKYQKPSQFPPFLGDLIFVYVGWGWVLVTLWGLTNAAFTAYLVQAPLDKKGRPLSSGSKDPNGTLLNGLKSKKEFVTSSAFAELALIARDDPPRRQTLYRELDRTGGSTWTQLVTVCLGELQAVSKRINDFTNPLPPTPNASLPELTQSTVNHLPRMGLQPKDGNVYANPPPPTHPHVAAFGSFARSTGNFPGAQDPFSPRAKRVLTSTVDRFLSPEQQQQFSESGIAKLFRRYFTNFVKVQHVGTPFRQTFARRVSAVVIAEPASGGSSLALLSNAITALAQLAVCASTEDSYGKASKDVATTIRTYSATITSIEDFITRLEPHWTDVDFSGKKVEDVDELLRVLKAGLRSMLQTYEGYRELGLTFKEKRIAREKAGLDRVEADPFIDAVGSDARVEMRERRRPLGAG